MIRTPSQYDSALSALRNRDCPQNGLSIQCDNIHVWTERGNHAQVNFNGRSESISTFDPRQTYPIETSAGTRIYMCAVWSMSHNDWIVILSTTRKLLQNQV